MTISSEELSLVDDEQGTFDAMRRPDGSDVLGRMLWEGRSDT
jgi:hypothetical protein